MNNKSKYKFYFSFWISSIVNQSNRIERFVCVASINKFKRRVIPSRIYAFAPWWPININTWNHCLKCSSLINLFSKLVETVEVVQTALWRKNQRRLHFRQYPLRTVQQAQLVVRPVWWSDPKRLYLLLLHLHQLFANEHYRLQFVLYLRVWPQFAQYFLDLWRRVLHKTLVLAQFSRLFFILWQILVDTHILRVRHLINLFRQDCFFCAPVFLCVPLYLQ